MAKTFWYLVATAIILFLYIPVVVTVIYSFNEAKYVGDLTGFSLRWYSSLLRNERVAEALMNSLKVAIPSSVISTFLGFALAYSAHRHGVLGPRLETLLYLPIVIPEVPEAVSLSMFFYTFGFSFGWLTVLIGHTAFNVSFAYVTVKSQLYGIEANIVRAARVFGASGHKLATKVILPLAAPGLLAGGLMTFILSFNNFVKTAFTTGPGFETLPLLIWKQAVRGRATSELNALASILLILSLAMSVLYTRVLFLRGRAQR